METVIKIDSPHEFSDSTNMVLSNQRRLVPGRLGILVRQYNEIAGQTAFDIRLAHTFENRSDLIRIITHLYLKTEILDQLKKTKYFLSKVFFNLVSEIKI